MLSLLALKGARQKVVLPLTILSSEIVQNLSALGFGDEFKFRTYSNHCIVIIGYIKNNQRKFEIALDRLDNDTHVAFFVYSHPQETRFAMNLSEDVTVSNLNSRLAPLYMHIPSYVPKRLDYTLT